jgi:predicted ArsR family transcriptional regulator
MDDLPGERRFFSSTRGRILVLLRRANRTVDELAAALDLTDNAVRTQLATLERDGWVERGAPRRERRGAGKPAFTYQLTRQAARLFPQAYALLLAEMLDVLAEVLPPAERDTVLRAVGERLPAALPVAAGSPQDRVGAAAALLTRLGGLVEVEQQDGRLILCGYSCPFAAVVPGHPEVCGLVQRLLASAVGQPVQERCAREAPVWCRFDIVAT